MKKKKKDNYILQVSDFGLSLCLPIIESENLF